MEVICEIIKLKPERVEEYVEMHRKTWPELVKAIREAGFTELYVYILGNVVIVFMKCENFAVSSASAAKNDYFNRWDVEVRAMLMSDEKFFLTNEVLVDLKPIWNLGDFDQDGVLKASS